MLFHVFKNDCKIEAMQLGHVEKIERARVLYLIVAWCIARLMRLGCTLPDMNAILMFDRDEWQAAYILNKKKPPVKPLTLNEVVRLVARLGGFLACRVMVSLASRRSGWACNTSSILLPGSGIQEVSRSSRFVYNDMHIAHISMEAMNFLANPPRRFEYVHALKHSSWLNLIECAFSKMAQTSLRHIRVKSKDELKERILKSIAEFNATPVAFRRNKFDLGVT